MARTFNPKKATKGFAGFIALLIVLGVLTGLTAAGATMSVVIGGSILDSAGWMNVMSVTEMATIGAIGGAIFAPFSILGGIVALGLSADKEADSSKKAIGYAVAVAIPVLIGTLFSLFAALTGASIIGMKGTPIAFSAAAGAIGSTLGPVVFLLGAAVLAAIAFSVLACCSDANANLPLTLKAAPTGKPLLTPTKNVLNTDPVTVSPLLRLSVPQPAASDTPEHSASIHNSLIMG